MTDQMPDSPLVKRIVDAARTDPQGAEAGMETAVRKMERWMDERAIDGDRRRQMQERIDQALAEARRQLGADEPAWPDVSGSPDVSAGPEVFDVANDAGRPPEQAGARSFRAGPVGALLGLACILAAAFAWWAGFFPALFPTSADRPLFTLDAGTPITAAADNTIDRSPGDVAFTLRSTAEDPTSGYTTGGAFIALSPEVEDLASGRTVRVTIRAATVADRPSAEFAVAYSTASVGNSGWRKFAPDSRLQSWSFDYTVPKRLQDEGEDYIGIWADTSGTGGGIRIEDIRLQLVEQPD
ncbi:hypothetical protein DFR52_103434 [Hoeflea marina]|uniref:Uncharacterized protein n=1 Tax=Hoeflea marina TaxID=274592 RepID=A0A317PIG0_9HYPH|nr:hypothetical protein [Hoeflea marina]PWW00232.1 hypothetical protein DFR52_103434 [Hoeflea marina]